MAGCNSDESLAKAKGPTILKVHEREAIIGAVKWVDELAYNNPYDVTVERLDEINCHSYIHGDDIVYNDEGEDYCSILAKVGRFKMIKRTTGVSTTDITGKLLKLLEPDTPTLQPTISDGGSLSRFNIADPPKQQFLQTSTRISNFSNRSNPKPTDTIVYFGASCDLMHPGVVERLKLAKQQGDYLYVGLWDDDMIRYYKGNKYPLQGL